MTLRTKWFLLGAAAFVATAFGVFVLPFLLPPAPIAAVSASNCAGFNNRVAILAAAAIAIAVFEAAWSLRLQVRLPSEHDCVPLSRRTIFTFLACFSFVAIVLDVSVYLSGLRYLSDYGYFIEQMTKAADYHRHLYSQLELPYGPLLFYPAIWVRGLFHYFAHALAAAHVFTLLLHQIGGLLLVVYVIQRLPIAHSLRFWALVCIAPFGISLTIAPNEALLRFAAPVACLMFCTRGRRLLAAWPLVFLAQLAMFGVSAEMGVAFAAGAMAFALLRAISCQDWRWLSLWGAPPLGAAVFFAAISPAYLTMLREFSGGAYNFLVEPQPYVLWYLLALVWLIPLCLASCWQQRREDAALLSSLFVIGLTLLPVAFGRADPLHVVLNGLIVLLLGLVPASVWRKRSQQIWVGVMALVMLFAYGTMVRSWRAELQMVAGIDALRFGPASLRGYLLRTHPTTVPGLEERLEVDTSAIYPPFDVERLREITGGEVVATPAKVTPLVEAALQRKGMYLPDQYAYLAGIVGAKSEQREIGITNSARWLLLPASSFPFDEETPESSQETLGLPFPYQLRREPFVTGVLMRENLARNWRAVERIDDYTLYRRRW